MVKATYQLVVDWANTGNFRGTGENVSSRLASFDAFRGRDFASALTGRSIAGKLTASLDNTSEDYSSFNTSSPLNGLVLPGRKVRLRSVPPIDYYMVFKALNDEVRITDAAAIQNVFDGGGGTVEALVRADSDGGGDFARIVDKANWFLAVREESAGKVKVRFRQSFSGTNGTWTTTSTVLTNGIDHHVSVAYDNSSVTNDPIIRVDGVVVAITETGTPVGTRTSDAGSDLIIGNRTAGNRNVDGTVDEVRLWNDIRTADEIDDNKFVELVGTEAGLQGYWRFDEGTGTTVADATSNNNNGTITGATWDYIRSILWTGFLDRIQPIPSLHGAKRAKLIAFGPLAHINQRTLDLAMATSKLTGQGINDILDEVGWPSGDRDIDTGKTTMARFWISETQTIEALRIVERTESGFLRETADGKLRFEDRHRRLLSPHTVSQATFSDAVGSTLRYSDPVQTDPLPFVFNTFEASIQLFTVEAIATLWTHPETGADSPLISPGETRAFFAEYPTPVAGSDAIAVDVWTTPVATTDYTANSASDGSGTDLTSDIAVVATKFATLMEIALTNNGSTPAFITALKARGTAVTLDDPVKVKATDTASETAYGERTFPLSTHFVPNTDEGQQWADFNLSIYKDEIPVVSIRIPANVDRAHLDQVLQREVSDRITLTATSRGTGLGINEDFFIESVAHSVDDAGVHDVTWQLSPASGFSGFWILGTSKLTTQSVLAY